MFPMQPRSLILASLGCKQFGEPIQQGSEAPDNCMVPEASLELINRNGHTRVEFFSSGPEVLMNTSSVFLFYFFAWAKEKQMGKLG